MDKLKAGPARYVVLPFAALAMLGVLVLLITVVPDWLANESTSKVRSEDEGRVRTALLASVAGLIAVFGAYVSHRSSRTAQKALETDRYTRAVEQLGNNDQEAVRLGGIYALEQIMRESIDLRGVVVELLSAYVRSETTKPGIEAAGTREPSTRTDVAGALTVLGRNNVPGVPIDLSGANLLGAKLAGVDFTEANLSGTTLNNAILRHARLDGANLVNTRLVHAKLGYATLTGARCFGAGFTGADLHGADLTGANLDEVNLTGANVERADLTGVDLTSARLTGTNVAAAILIGTRLPLPPGSAADTGS